MERVTRVVLDPTRQSFIFDKDFFEIIQIVENEKRREIEKQFGSVANDFAISRDSRIISISRESTNSSSSSGRSYSIMAPPMDAFSLNEDQSASPEPMANFVEVVKVD